VSFECDRCDDEGYVFALVVNDYGLVEHVREPCVCDAALDDAAHTEKPPVAPGGEAGHG
jgi:hypothetical protein